MLDDFLHYQVHHHYLLLKIDICILSIAHDTYYHYDCYYCYYCSNLVCYSLVKLSLSNFFVSIWCIEALVAILLLFVHYPNHIWFEQLLNKKKDLQFKQSGNLLSLLRILRTRGSVSRSRGFILSNSSTLKSFETQDKMKSFGLLLVIGILRRSISSPLISLQVYE